LCHGSVIGPDGKGFEVRHRPESRDEEDESQSGFVPWMDDTDFARLNESSMVRCYER